MQSGNKEQVCRLEFPGRKENFLVILQVGKIPSLTYRNTLLDEIDGKLLICMKLSTSTHGLFVEKRQSPVPHSGSNP
jgi:hypothetical protein